ncbi:MAG: alpha/beta hydrolase [Kiritimatiellae bacterium]|nr:alpha/beta hydrolase [Kiritimatiellia bacterium]MDD5522315.1 alpha/beta hydrolase [Kiritimatiellia bacterium]
MKYISILLCGCVFISVSCLNNFATEKMPAGCIVTNISYYDENDLASADDYQKEQCRLDLCYPTNKTGFATVVWFHGGGLTKGRRHFPALKAPEIAIAAVGYRLSPKGKLPSFIEDAAAATAWVIRNIGQYGGDSNKVFISGHSAGGYLTAMIGMDPKWLAACGISNQQLAGLIPVSAQVTTHFHVKKLRGDKGPEYRPIIDEYAPLYHSASNLPPICLILGDRKIEYKNRVEENELLAASLRNLGHPCVEFYEMGGLDHGTVGEGGMVVMRQFIRKILKTMNSRTR